MDIVPLAELRSRRCGKGSPDLELVRVPDPSDIEQDLRLIIVSGPAEGSRAG